MDMTSRAKRRLMQRARRREKQERNAILTPEEALRESLYLGSRVSIVVKGMRPMYSKTWPYGFNYFFLACCNQSLPIPLVCQMLGIDPLLINSIYFDYRNLERWPEVPKHLPNIDTIIAAERRQIITNIFPFPRLRWLRESGSDGCWPLAVHRKRKNSRLNEKLIRANCAEAHAASEAFHRELAKRA